MIEMGAVAAPAGTTGPTRLWLMAARSGATVDNYVHDLGLIPWGEGSRVGPLTWLSFLGRRGLDPLQVDSRAGFVWADELKGATVSPGTKGRLLTTARTWYAALAHGQVRHGDPLRWITRKRAGAGSSTLPRPLSWLEWGWMFDAARQDHGLAVPAGRSLALNELLSGVGVRSGEVPTMRVRDVLEIGGDWWFTVRGKGGVVREVRGAPETGQALTAYWAARGVGNDSEPAITTRAGRPLDPRMVQYAVTRWGSMAKIGRRVWPHLLRHTLATRLHDNGVPVRKTQVLLGHADAATTQRIYDHAEDGPSPQELQLAVPRVGQPLIQR